MSQRRKKGPGLARDRAAKRERSAKPQCSQAAGGGKNLSAADVDAVPPEAGDSELKKRTVWAGILLIIYAAAGTWGHFDFSAASQQQPPSRQEPPFRCFRDRPFYAVRSRRSSCSGRTSHDCNGHGWRLSRRSRCGFRGRRLICFNPQLAAITRIRQKGATM